MNVELLKHLIVAYKQRDTALLEAIATVNLKRQNGRISQSEYEKQRSDIVATFVEQYHLILSSQSIELIKEFDALKTQSFIETLELITQSKTQGGSQ